MLMTNVEKFRFYNMVLEIYKEKDTLLLGTGFFIGFVIGGMIPPFDFKSDVLTRLILLCILYGVSLSLVVIVKWNDRLRYE